MNNIPTKEDNPNGFHQRYVVRKVVKWRRKGDELIAVTKAVDDNAEYITFRLDEGSSDMQHIKAGRIAAHAYADAIQHHLPELAKDLKERYPLL